MNAREYEQIINKIATDGIDAPTAHEIAMLETYANEHDEAAAQLRDLRPNEPVSFATLDEHPTANEWDSIWHGIVADTARQPAQAATQTARKRPWMLRPLTAAAACVLMVGSLSWFTPLRASEMPLAFDAHAEIHEIEVFDGDSSFVLCGSGEEDCAFIWVVENEEADATDESL